MIIALGVQSEEATFIFTYLVLLNVFIDQSNVFMAHSHNLAMFTRHGIYLLLDVLYIYITCFAFSWHFPVFFVPFFVFFCELYC